MFKQQQVKKADMRAEFTEFLCDMKWCYPCFADPLSFDELLSQGAFLLNKTPPESFPGRGRRSIMPPMAGARDFCSNPPRAHYDAQHSTLATVIDGGHIPPAYPAAA